jgi:hypothetical protein
MHEYCGRQQNLTVPFEYLQMHGSPKRWTVHYSSFLERLPRSDNRRYSSARTRRREVEEMGFSNQETTEHPPPALHLSASVRALWTPGAAAPSPETFPSARRLSKETANEESEMRSKGKNKERGRRKYNKEKEIIQVIFLSKANLQFSSDGLSNSACSLDVWSCLCIS